MIALSAARGSGHNSNLCALEATVITLRQVENYAMPATVRESRRKDAQAAAARDAPPHWTYAYESAPVQARKGKKR